jgi:ABC-type nitrate/sulfonate/bicarbonate transport system permease component
MEMLGSVDGWKPRLTGVGLVFVAWLALASVFPNELMPYPHQAIAEAWIIVESGQVWLHLAATMSAMFWGFIGGMILGIQMGVFMGIDEYQRKFLTPHVILSLSIPHISWGITATLVFGFDILAPIVATILVVFPFVAVTVWKGVENIDAELLEMSKSFELSFARTLRRAILPNIAPSLLSASRLALAMSWKTVVITEVFASGRGMGYEIFENYELINFDAAWGWAVIFMVVILIVEYGVFKPIQRKVFAYRQDADFSLLA